MYKMSVINATLPNTPNSLVLNNNDLVPLSTSIPTAKNPSEQVRRSTRQTTRPVWLKDFVDPTPANKHAPHYHLFASTKFMGLPQPHITFLANFFGHHEPTRYKQTLQHSGWIQTMDKELEALEKNNTLSLTTLPPGHKPISSK
ncbi:hypothetical protein Tco_0801757 [Tanacetum coccineum]|uniref:Uncharacterized protein n=1 Tax=Tanacetum coccineum TaxID=301880 RepID=A0ABQ4ZWV8_9ASTR